MAVMLVGSIYFFDVIKGEFFQKHVSSKTLIFDIFRIFLGEAWIGREHVPTPSGSLLHPVKHLQRPYRVFFDKD